MGKLLAIDGLNIVRRVYEANDEPDSAEKAERALRNSQSSFKRLLDTHQPTHVLAAFDFGGVTWRHALYEKYRADRKEIPAVLKERLPDFFGKLADIGLVVLSIPEVEADDVIATGVTRWLSEGRGEAIVASTDKDLHGLIAYGAIVWDHFKGEWHDRAWVEKKFGVPPEKMTDLLALMGDASDGIPGVSNVGIKTAAKLLHSYGNLDGIMAGAGILLNPLGVKLRKDRDLAMLSRKLAELKTDVSLGVTWKMLQYHG
ncbi:MAG: 5'-3' exonuclease [Burkholderiales bacterium RIFCSPLOWO2_02_FULL_57_36]|nr:MAG: 5'-3' exonuclease [Burkholderiales bacterium RIFCSPLOWO2_02_FULL_57_36]